MLKLNFIVYAVCTVRIRVIEYYPYTKGYVCKSVVSINLKSSMLPILLENIVEITMLAANVVGSV